MKKYEEQKSKIKTVSIGRIYEWVSEFLLELANKFKENDSLSIHLKEDIIKEYNECKIVYLQYISLRKRYALRAAKARKKLCEQLLKVAEENGFISMFKKTLLLIYWNGIASFKSLEELKESNNMAKMNLNNIKSVINKINEEAYKKSKVCSNEAAKMIDANEQNIKTLKKDLKKIQKETDVTSVISFVMTNRNKISYEKETLMSVVLDYATNVTSFVKLYLNLYRTYLKKYYINPDSGGSNPNGSTYVGALTEMLKCWDGDYSAEKIQKAKVTQKYCRELFNKLKSIAKKKGIDQMYELGILLLQLLTKFKTHLENYLFKKEYAEKNIDFWLAEFNKSFGTVTNDNKDRVLNKENMGNLLKSVDDLLEKYNSEMYKYRKYINEFDSVYATIFHSDK